MTHTRRQCPSSRRTIRRTEIARDSCTTKSLRQRDYMMSSKAMIQQIPMPRSLGPGISGGLIGCLWGNRSRWCLTGQDLARCGGHGSKPIKLGIGEVDSDGVIKNFNVLRLCDLFPCVIDSFIRLSFLRGCVCWMYGTSKQTSIELRIHSSVSGMQNGGKRNWQVFSQHQVAMKLGFWALVWCLWVYFFVESLCPLLHMGSRYTWTDVLMLQQYVDNGE